MSLDHLAQSTKPKFVIVPSEQVLLAVMPQPESGIQFEQVRFLESTEGGGASVSFSIRNSGTRPIRQLTVGGPDWTISWSEQFTKKLLMPGERAFDKNDVEIVPLTDSLRNKLQLNGPMKAILVLMVVEVEFADGTRYSAKSTREALKKYSESLSAQKTSVKLN